MTVGNGFPLKKLECQYFEICQFYDSKLCKFDKGCNQVFIPKGSDLRIPVRNIFKMLTENYVEQDCLDMQVRLISDEQNGVE